MADKLSIIIPTKDREKDLLNCIYSILRQSYKPDELIIIDDGNLNNKYVKDLLAKERIKYIYIKKSKPGAARSRNMGLKKANGNYIMFLDDDVILDKDYIYHILDVFKNDKYLKIGGVGGDIINTKVDPISFYFKIQKILKKVFIITSEDQGTILPSGFDVPIGRVKFQKKVEILSGCNMSFRRKAFDSFDENFDGQTGYSHGEDTDLSFRVSKKYELIVTPLAKMIHLSSPNGRMSSREFIFHMIYNRCYFFSKNMSKTVKNCLCFIWAICGLFIITILSFLAHPNKEKLQQLLGWADAIKYYLIVKRIFH